MYSDKLAVDEPTAQELGLYTYWLALEQDETLHGVLLPQLRREIELKRKLLALEQELTALEPEFIDTAY